MERRMAEQKARANGPQPAKQGFFARLMEQAGDQQAKRAGSSKSGGAKGSGSTKGGGSKSTPPRGGTGSGAKGGQKPSGSKGAPPPPSGRTRSRRPNTGQGKTPRKPTDPMTPSGGDDGDGEAGS
jgi:hypothetical protein